MKFQRSGYALFQEMQVRKKICELEGSFIDIVLLVDSKALWCVASNDAVVDLDHRQLDDRLIYLTNGFSVQRDMLILILHVASHGGQQIRVLNGPGRKVVVGSVRILFTVQIEIQNQTVKNGIAADIAMKATFD